MEEQVFVRIACPYPPYKVMANASTFLRKAPLSRRSSSFC
jgi:hypothetical protein